jgi:DNA-binding NarL/FixJ family response regulator
MTASEQVVLIGEPDHATSALYERMIGVAYSVIATTHEATFMHLLRTRSIVALVLEPEMFTAHSGEQLATVSQICAARGTPMVFCSTQDVRRQGIALGAAACLIKPTLPAALLETLQSVIEGGPGAMARPALRPARVEEARKAER